MTTDDDNTVALLIDVTAAIREEFDLPERDATRMAAKVVRGIRRRVGGRMIYVPAAPTKERYAAILRAFDGTNQHEVCKAFGISRATLYRALRAAKRRES